MKVCICCNISKDFSEFYERKLKKSIGYLPNCKKCTKEKYNKNKTCEDRTSIKVDIKTYKKQHVKDNQEHYKEYRKKILHRKQREN